MGLAAHNTGNAEHLAAGIADIKLDPEAKPTPAFGDDDNTVSYKSVARGTRFASPSGMLSPPQSILKNGDSTTGTIKSQEGGAFGHWMVDHWEHNGLKRTSVQIHLASGDIVEEEIVHRVSTQGRKTLLVTLPVSEVLDSPLQALAYAFPYFQQLYPKLNEQEVTEIMMNHARVVARCKTVANLKGRNPLNTRRTLEIEIPLKHAVEFQYVTVHEDPVWHGEKTVTTSDNQVHLYIELITRPEDGFNPFAAMMTPSKMHSIPESGSVAGSRASAPVASVSYDPNRDDVSKMDADDCTYQPSRAEDPEDHTLSGVSHGGTADLLDEVDGLVADSKKSHADLLKKFSSGVSVSTGSHMSQRHHTKKKLRTGGSGVSVSNVSIKSLKSAGGRVIVETIKDDDMSISEMSLARTVKSVRTTRSGKSSGSALLKKMSKNCSGGDDNKSVGAMSSGMTIKSRRSTAKSVSSKQSSAGKPPSFASGFTVSTKSNTPVSSLAQAVAAATSPSSSYKTSVSKATRGSAKSKHVKGKNKVVATSPTRRSKRVSSIAPVDM